LIIRTITEIISQYLRRCTYLFIFFLLFGCTGKKEKQVQRSFYYWKSTFKLTEKEKSYLSALSVHHLYIKLFDVDWNEQKQAPEPVAKINFSESPSAHIIITPVVFLTNETLQQSRPGQLDTLAQRMTALAGSICGNNQLRLSGEFQIDCDWTSGTKEKYFHFLETVKKQFFLRDKKLSATIRLHQLKFISQNGIPPADKGLLMCYNMGNLQHPATKNSILELAELKSYINHLKTYPLPLNVALPLFDWYVLFDHSSYKGLIHSIDMRNQNNHQTKTVFTQDTILSGYSFSKGQWLRHEQSQADEVRKCAEYISRKLNYSNIDIILYHLDEKNLTNYEIHELESIYNSFR
jgi:hypothetical protein